MLDTLPARKVAETRHLRLREEACAVVVNELKPLYPHLHLSDIDGDAVDQARRWAEAPDTTMRPRSHAPWDWRELWKRFRNHACRVDLAIRDAEVPCALPVPELVRYYERLGFTRHVHRRGVLSRLVHDITVDGHDLTAAVDRSSRLPSGPTHSGGQR